MLVAESSIYNSFRNVKTLLQQTSTSAVAIPNPKTRVIFKSNISKQKKCGSARSSAGGRSAPTHGQSRRRPDDAVAGAIARSAAASGRGSTGAAYSTSRSSAPATAPPAASSGDRPDPGQQAPAPWRASMRRCSMPRARRHGTHSYGLPSLTLSLRRPPPTPFPPPFLLLVPPFPPSCPPPAPPASAPRPGPDPAARALRAGPGIIRAGFFPVTSWDPRPPPSPRRGGGWAGNHNLMGNCPAPPPTHPPRACGRRRATTDPDTGRVTELYANAAYCRLAGAPSVPAHLEAVAARAAPPRMAPLDHLGWCAGGRWGRGGDGRDAKPRAFVCAACARAVRARACVCVCARALRLTHQCVCM